MFAEKLILLLGRDTIVLTKPEQTNKPDKAPIFAPSLSVSGDEAWEKVESLVNRWLIRNSKLNGKTKGCKDNKDI